MLTIKKELLKEILFHEFLGYIVSNNEEYKEDQNFKFEFTHERENITFTCTSSYTYGADCYDDEDDNESKQKTEQTSLGCISEYYLSEILESFYLYEPTKQACEKYNMPFDLISYYDQLSELKNYYFSENEENVNYDYYYNHDTVKTIKIPIEEIAQFFISFSWTKPNEEFINSLKYIEKEKLGELMKIYQKDKLEEQLPTNIKKHKIKKL